MPADVVLTLRHVTTTPPGCLAEAILTPERWSEFTGWGPLPGIREAVFRERTDAVVGTKIYVTNTDGSSHTETIRVWDLPREIVLDFGDFVKPLSGISSGFEERFDFSEVEGGHHEIVRTMSMRPKHTPGRLALLIIRPMMERALMKHMRLIDRESA